MMVAGIDGGGTKIECVIASPAGEILGCGVGGPVNTNFSAVEAVVRSFDQAAGSALAAASLSGQEVEVVVAASPTNPVLLRTLIARRFPRANIVLVGEGELVLAAGGLIQRGVAVISGTGSLAMARDGPRVLAVGGGARCWVTRVVPMTSDSMACGRCAGRMMVGHRRPRLAQPSANGRKLSARAT